MYKLFLKKQNIQTTFKSSDSKGAKFKKSTLKKYKLFYIPKNFSKNVEKNKKTLYLTLKIKTFFSAKWTSIRVKDYFELSIRFLGQLGQNFDSAAKIKTFLVFNSFL